MNIEKIREIISRPLVAAALGFILGLIIGLPVLGWGVFPVKWTDAAPVHLRQDLKEDYLRMAIQAYAVEPNAQAALQRWQELGPEASKILDTLAIDPRLEAKDIVAFRGTVLAGQVVLPTMPGGQPTQSIEITPEVKIPTLPVVETKPAATTGFNTWVILLGVFCLLTLIIGGALFYILVVRKKKLGGAEPASPVYEQEYYEEGQEQSVAQFMTTYMLGDDLYDDSFSIDSPTGEFLGECGVGISDTIGVGEPKKVAAFEVWLFDKNDIQTVTKVLMSEHAYNDPNIRQRLLSKGEPVLIKPNERILLETATLQLEARVIDLGYGQGALPANSFFERLTLELAVWPRGEK